MMEPRFRRKQVPALNTASTSDISFMLLIFFLVTTSMNLDKGLPRILPPAAPSEQVESQVDKGSLLRISISSNGDVKCDGRKVDMKQLSLYISRHVTNRGKKHVVQLETSRKAKYDNYFQVQQVIVSTYRRLREEWAVRHLHKRLAYCSAAEVRIVRENVPQKVAEIYANVEEEDGRRVCFLKNAGACQDLTHRHCQTSFSRYFFSS